MVNARTADPVQAIQDLGGADVAISLAASPRAFEQAFGSLRRGGRLVCVALPADDKKTIPIFDTVLGGKSIIGSIVGTRQDLADVFTLNPGRPREGHRGRAAAGRRQHLRRRRARQPRARPCGLHVLTSVPPAMPPRTPRKQTASSLPAAGPYLSRVRAFR